MSGKAKTQANIEIFAMLWYAMLWLCCGWLWLLKFKTVINAAMVS